MPEQQLPRILHVIRCLAPSKGGTSESVPALARATAGTKRFTNDLLQFGTPTQSPEACAGVPFRTLPWRPLSLLAMPNIALPDDLREYAAMHLHGIWEPQCAATGRFARRANRPYVVSAHGMLEKWALRNKYWKKKIYGTLAERGNLQRAACLRALTSAELSDYRSYGLTGPVAVIPNGVQAPAEVDDQLFFNRFPDLEGKRIVMFLSRIHPKKGIDILCRSFGKIASRFGDAHLVIAGPDFENTVKSIRTLISELGIERRTTITGMLTGEMKWSALKSSALFVLPSYSEGFSVAILEALASGIPVLATYPCNFPELAESDAGTLTHPTERDIERELVNLLAMPPAELRAMGQRGLELVSRNYSWERIGTMMADVYDWILGGTIPTRVDIETHQRKTYSH